MTDFPSAPNSSGFPVTTLNAEAKNWLDANCRHPWAELKPDKANFIVSVFFASKEDAALFKMFWL